MSVFGEVAKEWVSIAAETLGVPDPTKGSTSSEKSTSESKNDEWLKDHNFED